MPKRRAQGSLRRPTFHHVALTVTDLEKFIPWYEELFSITYRMEAPHPGGVGKLLADDNWELVIVLHRHDIDEGETFDETRTGLDHLGFGVPSRAHVRWSEPKSFG